MSYLSKMPEEFEKKFTIVDINEVTKFTEQASSLFNGRHEFNSEWSAYTIEGLRPYVQPGT